MIKQQNRLNLDSLTSMGLWERQKAIYLLEVAESLDMNTTSYGELSVNNNSGYTYLWLEDYPFTLYMPIKCDLIITDVSAIYTDPYNGDEHEYSLSQETTLAELYKWVAELENESEESTK